MKKVAFICEHNSCKSQMTEVFGRVLGLNIFESYLEGTEERDCINAGYYSSNERNRN